jgi:hypothetical protein
MTNADLELAPRIVLSRLRDEPTEEIIAELERISRAADARRQHIREQDPPSNAWTGEATTVVIAPSRFLWDLPQARDLVDEIASKARSCGIRLHLLDTAPETSPGSGEYPIIYYGTSAVRVLAGRFANPVATFTSLPHEEMLAVTYAK